ncbi:PadR family transcriptional regulator [Streptomyces griseorubiginosus]|uniref:PadR family transcriptional regulator n=1 Tax=Streptomyces griseorubiginosus TaxID=67304 RepID=UPI0034521DC3
MPNGTLLPILTRLVAEGWLERYWEDGESAEEEGRPRRRYYRFTKDGLELARVEVARWHAQQTAATGEEAPWSGRPRPVSGAG